MTWQLSFPCTSQNFLTYFKRVRGQAYMTPSLLMFFWTTVFSAGAFLKLFHVSIVLTYVFSKYCTHSVPWKGVPRVYTWGMISCLLSFILDLTSSSIILWPLGLIQSVILQFLQVPWDLVEVCQHALPKCCFSKLKSPTLRDLSLYQMAYHSLSFVEPSVLTYPFRDVGPELHTLCRLMVVHRSFWEAQWYSLCCVYSFRYSYKCLIHSFNYCALRWHFHALLLAYHLKW